MQMSRYVHFFVIIQHQLDKLKDLKVIFERFLNCFTGKLTFLTNFIDNQSETAFLTYVFPLFNF